jgi:hypothetical protein
MGAHVYTSHINLHEVADHYNVSFVTNSRQFCEKNEGVIKCRVFNFRVEHFTWGLHLNVVTLVCTK